MRRIVPIFALAAGLALAGSAYPQSGNVGTNVGNGLNQPMVERPTREENR
jgi:hypothetical protein